MRKKIMLTVFFASSALGIFMYKAYFSGSVGLEKKYKLNRFGKLTSEVWRYQNSFSPNDLIPVQNNNPSAESQPKRDRPTRLILDSQGNKAYITLQGTEARPGNELVVFDLKNKKTIKRIKVGERPYGVYLHPSGNYLVVINEFSNYASIVDTRTDKNIGNIPIDYYCQGMVFSRDGKKMYVANRYLDQVLVVDLAVSDETLVGKVRELGGFSEEIFNGNKILSATNNNRLVHRGFSYEQVVKNFSSGSAGINSILRARCGSCHFESAGGFIAGGNAEANFLSAVENSVAGYPEKSHLLRAVLPKKLGGFGDVKHTTEFHPGGALFKEGERDLTLIQEWIKNATGGPGVEVGNELSHPKDLALSNDEKYLFVGNTGTSDVSIIDLKELKEVGGIYVGNVANHIQFVNSKDKKKDLLLVFTFGAGFGATKARDPFGAETWDRNHEAAQLSILRDPKTTDPYPRKKQFVLGPFDAIDGTWNIKMRDIQNDIIAVDLSSLTIPKYRASSDMQYLLLTNKYESHQSWVRYTSDSAEATVGDVKGDIPPELQRVPGAYPEWSKVVGEKLYVSMAGTFEIVEWKINFQSQDPAEVLVPLRSFPTGLRPVGFAVGEKGAAKEKIIVANQMGESIHIIDLNSGHSEEFTIGDLSVPLFATNAERGELVVHSSVFTSDGDTSCLHCHFRDTGDGRAWGAAETVGQDYQGHITAGGTLGIPSMRNAFAIQPYYFEGTHFISEGQGADISEPAGVVDFQKPVWTGDFTRFNSSVPKEKRRVLFEEIKEMVELNKQGGKLYDLEAKRDAFFKSQSKKYFGKEYSLNEFYPFVGHWLADTNHLVPNPYDKNSPSVKRGRKIFDAATTMCVVCHSDPEFTNKTLALANNDRRALPVLVTTSRRDASYSLASVHSIDYANGLNPVEKGRVEDKEGSFTTMQLRNLFDRPPVFLHHGRAKSIREVLLTPDHPALRNFKYPVLQGQELVRPNRKEIGFNELRERDRTDKLDHSTILFNTHGGTSHLTPIQISDLENFIRSIE